MPNRHGDLNMIEAAAYLGVAVDVLKALHAASIGPLFVIGVTKADKAAGPWFFVSDLDRFRPRLPAALLRLPVTGVAGSAKSTLAKHLPPGAAILSA
jgi:hypothetical protein